MLRMDGLDRSSIVWGLIILIYAICTSQNAYAIDNQSQWDLSFQALYSAQDPLLGDPGNYPGDLFAWHGHYWLRAYITMAKTYSDTKYLDKAVNLIDHMLYYRDDTRHARGELDLKTNPYLSAPLYYLNHRDEAAPGWRRYWDGDRIEVVTDGMITQAIMLFVDLAFNDKRFSFYQGKAKDYMEKVEETAEIHNSQFVYNRFPDVPGSYYFPNTDGSGLYSGDVPFNQSAIMATTLLLLDKVKGGVTEYRKKAEAILNYWKMHVKLTSNDAYDWNYYLRGSGEDEDFNHAHIDLIFLNSTYRFGLLDLVDMQRLANALIKNIYKGNGEISKYVNGSGTINSYGAVGFEAAYDWIDLAEIDATAFTIAMEVYEKHYTNPTWARPFFGWAEILRWSKLLNNSASPDPPENLRIVDIFAN